MAKINVFKLFLMMNGFASKRPAESRIDLKTPDNYSLLGLASCTILSILCPLWGPDFSHAKSINTLWPRIYKLLVEVINLVNLQVIFSLAYLLKGNC